MRHVLPNIVPPIIIIFSINIGAVIISRGVAQFPGIRAAHQGAELGRDAQPGRAGVHGDGTHGWHSGRDFALTIVPSIVSTCSAMPSGTCSIPRLRGGEGSYGTAKVKRKRGPLARLVNPFNW